jgi:SAM-dependent methyltransferase
MSPENKYHFILKWIAENDPEKSKSIVDFGCGNGDLVEYLIAKGYHAQGIEVDFFHESILANVKQELITQNQIHIVTSQDDFTKFSHRYDLLISHMVYEHVSDKDAFVQQIALLLKPGGKALLMFPSKEVLRESHIQQFFIHHLPDGKIRYLVSYIQCKLGLGYKKSSGCTIQEYINQKFEDIDKRCNYERVSRTLERFSKTFSIKRLEPEYIQSRIKTLRLHFPRSGRIRSVLTWLLQLYSFCVIEVRRVR